uniref:Uncharacterized protein n=1 Tax=Timema genevievae TaxID=629358 RepID=A0A7R9K8H0_TIMGE|nr:unnamed protein product [Timema genevievae]
MHFATLTQCQHWSLVEDVCDWLECRPDMCLILAAVLAVANAGYLGGAAVAYGAPALSYAAPAYASAAYAPAAITSQHSNILRTPGNLGQVSTYSKTIDTPYSSVSKSDVRVSNDALAYGAVPAYASYAAPAYHGAYAAPALAGHAYAAPALTARAYAAPAVAAHGGLLGVAYSAAPIVSHMTYSNAYGINYAY